MCDYTQVNYKCGHVRYLVKAWCIRYQQTHERCAPNVVAVYVFSLLPTDTCLPGATASSYPSANMRTATGRTSSTKSAVGYIHSYLLALGSHLQARPFPSETGTPRGKDGCIQNQKENSGQIRARSIPPHFTRINSLSFQSLRRNPPQLATV